MIQMKITLFFITCIQFVPYCLSVNSIFIDIVYTLILECPFIFQDQFIHKGRHPFHHDNKTIPTFIHILYVLTAEISPVQNESNLLITISGCFIQHELQLGDIIQTSWIFFIKQWFLIMSIIRNCIIKYRLSHIYFRMPKFDHFYISGLTVFIR